MYIVKDKIDFLQAMFIYLRGQVLRMTLLRYMSIAFLYGEKEKKVGMSFVRLDYQDMSSPLGYVVYIL